MEETHLFSNRTCYYDACSNAWYKVHNMSVLDGIFSKVDSEPCEPTTADFDFFLLPSFVDAHCHILENCENEPETQEQIDSPNINELLFRARNHALEACNRGVTCLKDLGGREFHAIDVIQQLQKELPVRLFTSGCYFTCPDGHCHDLGAIIIENLDEFKRSVDYLVGQGIKYCKFLLSDASFHQEFLNDMISYAHEKDMLVSCHAYTEIAAKMAVAAGTDILEHAGDYSDNLLRQIKDRNIIVVPTYVAAKDSTPENCASLNDVDISVLTDWIAGEQKVIPKLFEFGIRVALGTDCGFPGTPFDSLIREIQFLVDDFNIPLQRILYSAFVTTPETLGLANKLGKIAQGYYADFQCYYENPMVKRNKLGNPDEIWIKGQRIDIILPSIITYRRLAKQDIPELSTHLQSHFFNCGAFDDHWTDIEIENWISNNEDYCIGAFADNLLVGFCLSHYHKQVTKVFLENIYVTEGYRRRGIAEWLLAKVVNYYVSLNRKMRFVALVDIDNPPPVNLLLKSNFMKGHPMYWMQRNTN